MSVDTTYELQPGDVRLRCPDGIPFSTTVETADGSMLNVSRVRYDIAVDGVTAKVWCEFMPAEFVARAADVEWNVTVFPFYKDVPGLRGKFARLCERAARRLGTAALPAKL